MSTIGYATLSVIPSLQGAQASLQKQAAGPLAAAGKTGGRQYGDAAGVAAGSSFKSRFAAGLKGVAAPLAAFAGGAAVFGFFKEGVDSAREYEKAIAGANAIIKSTGGVARVTSADIDRLSASLEAQTAIDDAVIARSAALVLTFKNVANQGSGLSAIFDRTLAASLDLSAAGFGDVEGQAKALAKALNDPAKGLSMLSRSGVTFTEQQGEQIKALQETGDLLGAQKIILAEVESQVQGTAAAQVDGADEAAVAWDNLRQKVGAEVLPALNAFALFSAEKVVPAMSATVDVVTGAVGAFSDLPGPVKATAGAFVALKLSALIGLTGALRSGAGGLSGSMESLRIRSMLTADAFKATRANGGRLSATFSGIKAGAAGAAGALRGFVAAAIPVAALTAGITLYAKFRQAQEESKQRVEEHTAALDEQTGALTRANEEIAFNALQQSGAIDAARELGISLTLVREAAIGNEGALRLLNAQLDQVDILTSNAGGGVGGLGVNVDKATQSVGTLRGALGDQNSEVAQAIAGWKDQAEFLGDGADATDVAAEATKKYKSELDRAEGAVRRLQTAEAERRLDNIQERRDQIALRETIRAVREEARKGKQVLGDQSKAADDNLSALLDLAEQWNTSTGKVKNARGAYEDIRGTFIELADQMNGPNGTRKDAIKLADSLLALPKNVPLKFRSEGYQERMAEIRALKEAARDLQDMLNFQTLNKAAGDGSNPGRVTNYNINVDKVVADDPEGIGNKSRSRAGGGL